MERLAYKGKTLSEKVTALFSHATDSNDESDEEKDKPKVVQFNELEYPSPAAPSNIRKRNARLLSKESETYRGKIAKRQDFEEDNVTHENETASNTLLQSFHDKINKVVSSSHEDSNEMEEEEETEDEDEDDFSVETSGASEEEQHATDIEEHSNSFMQNVLAESGSGSTAEAQKGMHVQHQLQIWEKLLELRIQSQRVLSKANQLPEAAIVKEAVEKDEKVAQNFQETQKNLHTLLQSLLGLQYELYQRNSEMKNACKIKKYSALSDDDHTAKQKLALHLANNIKEFRLFRNKTLLKWEDRTKLLMPKTVAKRKLVDEYTIIQKIDNAIFNRKSTLQETESATNNETAASSTLTHSKVAAYDDTDFYQQLLREFIENKTSSVTNTGEVARQLLELQKARQQMKKKVDTRASKGRKIRYNVHKKLINFMAPCDSSNWTESSKNELYKSLFST